MARKARSRESIEKIFQKCRLAIAAQSGDKTEVLLRQMRTCRMQLAHDSCEELTGAICIDALRLELLHETNEMRRRAYLLPRESMVHKLPSANHGEHQFAAYNEHDTMHSILFYNDEQKKIQNFWAVPSFAEICSIDNQMTMFTKLNHTQLYKFDLGDSNNLDEYGRPILSEFTENNQRKLIKTRLPKLTAVDIAQADSAYGNH